MRVSRLGRSLHLLVGRVEIAVADILADRAFEQPCILQNHAEHRAQIVPREIADIVSADADRT